MFYTLTAAITPSKLVCVSDLHTVEAYKCEVLSFIY